MKFEKDLFAQKVAQKRNGQPLRECSTEVGISPATLSRIEKGLPPDIETFAKVCQWLNIDAGYFFSNNPDNLKSVIEEIAIQVHLNLLQGSDNYWIEGIKLRLQSIK